MLEIIYVGSKNRMNIFYVVIRLTETQNAMYWLLRFRQGKSVEHLLCTTVILISKLRSIDESLEIYYKSTGWFRYQ